MERKSWTVDVDGEQHSVVLNWTYWGGERQVVVDGAVAVDHAQLMRGKSRQAVDVAGRQAVVETRPVKRLSPYFRITLEVDGREIPAEPGPASRWEK